MELTGCGDEKVQTSHASGAQRSAERSLEDIDTGILFKKAWINASDDNYLTLFGFRRFRTAHLVNLRFLEEEIDKIDHQIFQAGIKLGYSPPAVDRLGLKHAKIDTNAQTADEIMTRKLVLDLRALLKQYGTRKIRSIASIY